MVSGSTASQMMKMLKDKRPRIRLLAAKCVAHVVRSKALLGMDNEERALESSSIEWSDLCQMSACAGRAHRDSHNRQAS